MLQISVAQLIHEIRLAHVSRDYPIPVLQLAALKKAGCKQVFKYDGLSGATTLSTLPCCAVLGNSNLAQTSTPQQSIGSQRQPPKSFSVP